MIENSRRDPVEIQTVAPAVLAAVWKPGLCIGVINHKRRDINACRWDISPEKRTQHTHTHGHMPKNLPIECKPQLPAERGRGGGGGTMGKCTPLPGGAHTGPHSPALAHALNGVRARR